MEKFRAVGEAGEPVIPLKFGQSVCIIETIKSEPTGDGQAVAGWCAEAIFDSGAKTVERDEMYPGFKGLDCCPRACLVPNKRGEGRKQPASGRYSVDRAPSSLGRTFPLPIAGNFDEKRAQTD